MLSPEAIKKIKGATTYLSTDELLIAIAEEQRKVDCEEFLRVLNEMMIDYPSIEAQYRLLREQLEKEIG